ncbi:TPA: hypothetical protein ACH1VU_006237 [Pseudomonas aeruginosa]
MSKPAYPSPKELVVLYAERDAAVAAMADKGIIEAADLAPLDCLGRCKVANEHWGICDVSARHTLLNDTHHFVRACACLAA